MTVCDIVICGLGGMGSAAFHCAASRGLHTIGIDPHPAGHSEGSSHGETRLIRKAYFEHPSYVPLLERAYELWDALDAPLENPVFHRTGLVIYGESCEKDLLADVRKSADLYKIPIEKLVTPKTDPTSQRFHLAEGWQGIFEPDAGYLEVERAVQEQVNAGLAKGGEIVTTGLVDWSVTDKGCSVKLTNGQTLECKHLVLALGAWSPRLTKCDLPLSVHRVPLYWFRPTNDDFKNGPCYAIDTPKGFFYGFRESRGLVKIAPHAPGPVVDPNSVDRSRLKAEDEQIIDFVREFLPSLNPEIMDHKVCMYTMTPDEHFVVDLHPRAKNVAFAAGMSGHGFKFSPMIGEVLVDLATTGATAQPIEFLRADRDFSVSSV